MMQIISVVGDPLNVQRLLKRKKQAAFKGRSKDDSYFTFRVHLRRKRNCELPPHFDMSPLMLFACGGLTFPVIDFAVEEGEIHEELACRLKAKLDLRFVMEILKEDIQKDCLSVNDRTTLFRRLSNAYEGFDTLEKKFHDPYALLEIAMCYASLARLIQLTGGSKQVEYDCYGMTINCFEQYLTLRTNAAVSNSLKFCQKQQKALVEKARGSLSLGVENRQGSIQNRQWPQRLFSSSKKRKITPDNTIPECIRSEAKHSASSSSADSSKLLRRDLASS